MIDTQTDTHTDSGLNRKWYDSCNLFFGDSFTLGFWCSVSYDHIWSVNQPISDMQSLLQGYVMSGCHGSTATNCPNNSHCTMIFMESTQWRFAVAIALQITIVWSPGWPQGCLKIKILSYQYKDSHYKDKMVSQPSSLYDGNTISGKMVFILRRGPNSYVTIICTQYSIKNLVLPKCHCLHQIHSYLLAWISV